MVGRLGVKLRMKFDINQFFHLKKITISYFENPYRTNRSQFIQMVVN